MHNTKIRSLILYLLIALFLVGIGFFVYEFAAQSYKWAFSPINRHLSEGKMSGGKIVDICDEVLAQTVEGKRVYSENEDVRKAMLHIVGDGSVLIPTSVQSRFSGELFGYNPITGFGAPGIFEMNQNVKITLDSKLCANVSKSFKDKKGAAVAYNYLSGEVLCMVSLPTYDINNRPSFSELSSEKYEGAYINRVISSSYTPGSIFKIFTTIAGLDLVKDIKSRVFECNKTKIIDGEKIVCMSSHGKIKLKEALSKSCDIVFGDIAIELGPELMKSEMKKLGLNGGSTIDGIEFSHGSYLIENASKADLGWSGIGQHKDKVNPLFMAKFMSAIANDGKPKEPFFVKSVYSDGASGFSRTHSDFLAPIMTPEVAADIKEMMRYTMKNNYGDSMFDLIPMCAKTGTAEVGEGKLPHGWMVGFSYDRSFPIAFAVIVENGNFGIKSAGPIASSMIKQLKKNFSDGKYKLN